MFEYWKAQIVMFDNDNDALIPEMWAAESVEILYESMVACRLVHRDFENEVASFGDVVNTRQPQTFTAKRKVDSEDVTTQDATSTNIPVPLDQHLHTSFVIKDGERSKAFKDLVAYYLFPAVASIGQAADKIVTGYMVAQWAFGTTLAGKLGVKPTKRTILDTRNILNKNKAHVTGRRLLLTPDSETDLLELDAFTDADRVGDEGTALREAALGRKLNFDVFMGQNTPAVETGTDTTVNDINNGNIAKGTTVITVTSGTGMSVGEFITIEGEGRPHIITGVSTNDITIWPALQTAIEDAAVVTVYDQAAVNQASTAIADGGDGSTAGYRAGWHGYIAFDTMTTAPEVGTLVHFGAPANATAAAASAKYVVIDVVGASFMVDRPLDAAIANDAKVNFGPTGQYNVAFHRNCLSLVTRPLELPMSQLAPGFVAVDSDNGIAVRVVMTYDGKAQGTRVTVDILLGLKKLNDALATLMLG